MALEGGLVVAFAFASIAGTLVVTTLPRAGDRRLQLVFAPWTSDAQAIVAAGAAGGRLLAARGGRVVVESEEAGFALRARRAGAWFVFRSGMRGCGAVAGESRA